MSERVGDTIDPALVERFAQRLRDNLDQLHQRLDRAGADGVVVLPVSKGQPVEAVVAAQRLELGALGESYAQELAAKTDHPSVAPNATEWHFVGQLQRNRVKTVAGIVDVWQSVDRVRVARAIAGSAPGARVLAQVNLSGDPGKAGCGFDELHELVADMTDLGLEVHGLMGVGTVDDPKATAAGFRRLRARVDEFGFEICSMGMTDDLEVAVDEGSTMVRVGTALFGPRPPRPR